MDPLPGWKTKVTAVVMGVFNVVRVFGWADVDSATAEQINAGLIAAISLFLAMKIDRGKQ